ncbi:MAG: type II toxin-antitoxin system VapC family toxin [Bryobacteraceae bacterium]
MRFLLDTNVISEWVRPLPDPNVIAWLAEADEDRVFLSVTSFAEVRQGIELLPDGRRRDRLTLWLTEELPARFEGRILPIDRRIAEAWGVVTVRGRKAGVTLGSMDAFFAATAETHSLTLVTRNVKDFAALGIRLLDPWELRRQNA